MVKDSITYPFRGDGWVVIALGALLAGVLQFVSHLPLLGFVAAVFSFGYFASFYFDIVRSTITGHDRCPDWPGFSNFWDDILLPYLQILFVLVLSCLPMLLCLITVDRSAAAFLMTFAAAFIFAGFYFSMAVLGIVSWGGMRGALPDRVLPAIMRCSPAYLMIFLALLLVGLATFSARAFLLQVPFVGWFLSAALFLYLMMAKARFLGLFYLRYQERIGWS